jgi:hypothetical protein
MAAALRLLFYIDLSAGTNANHSRQKVRSPSPSRKVHCGARLRCSAAPAADLSRGLRQRITKHGIGLSSRLRNAHFSSGQRRRLRRTNPETMEPAQLSICYRPQGDCGQQSVGTAGRCWCRNRPLRAGLDYRVPKFQASKARHELKALRHQSFATHGSRPLALRLT